MTLRLQPCLHDWWEQAGALGNEYFWQDLFVAQMIHKAAPRRHIDIGSRLDGFVAHLASFRQLEVFDVRHLDVEIPGVTFRQADIMKSDQLPTACADSVSCLHAIEHFGLGRYGDPLEPNGVELGLANISRMLEPGGALYLSCPFGDDIVHFNAHRALTPTTIMRYAAQFGLTTNAGWIYDAFGKKFDLFDLDGVPTVLTHEPSQFTLLLFVFRKNV